MILISLVKKKSNTSRFNSLDSKKNSMDMDRSWCPEFDKVKMDNIYSVKKSNQWVLH
jgi:hypothetical protein